MKSRPNLFIEYYLMPNIAAIIFSRPHLRGLVRSDVGCDIISSEIA